MNKRLLIAAAAVSVMSAVAMFMGLANDVRDGIGPETGTILPGGGVAPR